MPVALRVRNPPLDDFPLDDDAEWSRSESITVSRNAGEKNSPVPGLDLQSALDNQSREERANRRHQPTKNADKLAGSKPTVGRKLVRPLSAGAARKKATVPSNPYASQPTSHRSISSLSFSSRSAASSRRANYASGRRSATGSSGHSVLSVNTGSATSSYTHRTGQRERVPVEDLWDRYNVCKEFANGIPTESTIQLGTTLIEGLNEEAMALLNEGQVEDADVMLGDARVIVSALGGDRVVNAALLTLNNIACVHRRNGDLAGALSVLKEAERAELRMGGASVETLLNMCAVYSGLGRHDEALHTAMMSVDAAKQCSDQPALLVAALYNVGAENEHLGRYDSSYKSYSKALRLGTSRLGSKAPVTLQIRDALVQLKNSGKLHGSMSDSSSASTRANVDSRIEQARARRQASLAASAKPRAKSSASSRSNVPSQRTLGTSAAVADGQLSLRRRRPVSATAVPSSQARTPLSGLPKHVADALSPSTERIPSVSRHDNRQFHSAKALLPDVDDSFFGIDVPDVKDSVASYSRGVNRAQGITTADVERAWQAALHTTVNLSDSQPCAPSTVQNWSQYDGRTNNNSTSFTLPSSELLDSPPPIRNKAVAEKGLLSIDRAQTNAPGNTNAKEGGIQRTLSSDDLACLDDVLDGYDERIPGNSSPNEGMINAEYPSGKAERPLTSIVQASCSRCDRIPVVDCSMCSTAMCSECSGFNLVDPSTWACVQCSIGEWREIADTA